jgi:D-amino peptidase
MKIYISADIEGITGVTHWDETDLNKPSCQPFRQQMTAEVAAACQGALQAGAKEIWVKDAHDTGRNISAADLPQQAKLLRGWSGHPFGMLESLDESFQALALIGYHSRASSGASPLAHTMSGSITYMKINDRFASEFLIAAYTAALVKVPLVLVSGDEGLCLEVFEFHPEIRTAVVKSGSGDGTVASTRWLSAHPKGVRAGKRTYALLPSPSTSASRCASAATPMPTKPASTQQRRRWMITPSFTKTTATSKFYAVLFAT